MYISTMKVAFPLCTSTISPLRGKQAKAPLKMAQYAGDYVLLISDQQRRCTKIQR
jgi:hypothetical protein